MIRIRFWFLIIKIIYVCKKSKKKKFIKFFFLINIRLIPNFSNNGPLNFTD